MQPKLEIIDTLDGLKRLVVEMQSAEYIAYDCETTGVSRDSRIIGLSVCWDEAYAYYVILEKWNTEKACLESTECEKYVLEFYAELKTKKLIMHNAVFDCAMAERAFNVSLINSVHTDTMILAHLLNENRRVGLKELGKSLFGQDAAAEQKEMKESVVKNGGKITIQSYEMYKADSYVLGKYGAKDAWLTYKLFIELVPELYDQKLDDFFYIDESMPLLRGATYDMNTCGLKIDQTKLTVLKKTLEAECLEAKEFILRETFEYTKERYPGTTKAKTFNINSSKQLSWLLFIKLGLEFQVLTDLGKEMSKELGVVKIYTKSEKRRFIEECTMQAGREYTAPALVNGRKVAAKKIKNPWDYIKCDKVTLTKLAPKYKWIQALLDYQRKTKLLTTYIKGIEIRIQYGIIQPSFLQHGTTSGRYSSRNPNFQNLPRDDKRVKACIVARPDKVFVGADYSQLEPRVFSYYSGDKRLQSSFIGDTDFYSMIGMFIYDKHDCVPKKEGSPDAFGVKYKHLRTLSKTLALAVTYGATAYRLSSTTGKTAEETQKDIDNYFEQFPGVKNMMLESHNAVKKDGFVLNLFNRPRRMPEAKNITQLYGDTPHGELPYAYRNILNLAVNHRIQSTAASIVNRAMIKFYNNAQTAGITCKIVLQVHDEIIVECSAADAENVSLLLQDAMETVVSLKDVALEAIPHIGKNLGELK